MELRTEAYPNEGMYLRFVNGDTLDLSVARIRKLADEYWNNPAKLSPQIRNSVDFKTCSICPYRGQNVFCSALKPILPFLERLEQFSSYDKVTAIYRTKDNVLCCADTVLQKALQFVTSMALFEYCEDAKQYHIYFKGVTPFMGWKESAIRIFLNIYWVHRGDEAKVKLTVKEMCAHVNITTTSCVKRLNAMCESDSFINAYVETHGFSTVLEQNIEALVERYFRSKL